MLSAKVTAPRVTKTIYDHMINAKSGLAQASDKVSAMSIAFDGNHVAADWMRDHTLELPALDSSERHS
jgi:hypothetical protein